MTGTFRGKRVLCVGGFVMEAIAEERGLPWLNVAGANRVKRLAEAMHAAGAEVFLVSSASAMRLKWVGVLRHPSRVLRVDGIGVLFTWCIGVRYLSFLLEPLAMLVGVRALCKRRRPDIVLVFNYFPATLLAGIATKWCYGARMIFDIEDVSVPRVADWFGRGDKRPLLQLGGWWLLKVGVAAADCVMVPSRRFLATARIVKRNVIVTGCIAAKEYLAPREKGSDEPLRVLISGTLDEEQGLGLVLNAIKEATAGPPLGREIVFDLCGFAENANALRASVAALAQAGVRITYHGVVGRAVYFELLLEADVCVAMQRPDGRHGSAKTPSKVYEYLAHGKVVIASDVGDLRELPADIISLCEWHASTLASRLRNVRNDWGQWMGMGERAAAFAAREFALRVVGERIIRCVVPGLS